MGREGRHGDQFGARHFAPAAVSPPAGRGVAGLAAGQRSRAAARPWRRLRLSQPRRHLPRARGAVGIRERRRARLRHRRAGDAGRRRIRGARADAMAAPAQRQRAEAVLRRRRLLSSRWPRALCRRRGPAAAAAERGVRPRPQHRPGARPVAHDDPHRPVAAPGAPSRGAVRRGSSRRRRATGPQRRRLCAPDDGARRGGTESRRDGEPAPRLAVRADPLDRRHRRPGARRRADPCVGRSDLRPTRFESDAGDDRAESDRRRGLCRLAPPGRAARLARPRAHSGSRRRGGHLRFGRAPGGARRLSYRTGSAAPRRRAGAPTRAASVSSRRPSPTDRLDTLLHVAPKLDRAALDAAIALLARPTIDARERRFALAGRTLGDGASASPLVCACFAVRRDAIEAAIAAGAASVDAVGQATRAGTNCGSCRAEIRQLVTSRDAVAAIVAGQGD